MSILKSALGAAALGIVVAGAATAQRRPPGGGGFNQFFGGANDYYQPPDFHGNPRYDGRFTFARIKYRGYEHWAGREGPGWSHDYPDAEENFMKILLSTAVIIIHQ